MPEAVYGPGKTAEQCVAIVGELLDGGRRRRCCSPARDAAGRSGGHRRASARASHAAACVLWRARPRPHRTSQVLVVSAGTADVPVVDECILTLQALGFDPDRLTDVGVAGLHRLLAHLERVTSADAVVVVAGMEGALASVIGGLTSCARRRRAHLASATGRASTE